MAAPSNQSVSGKSLFKRLAKRIPFLSKKLSIDSNFNISSEIKSYRKQTQQKLLDSHYVSSELFETVMDAFDELELEALTAEQTEIITEENSDTSQKIKDGEFTLIFSKKKNLKSSKNIKGKSSKNTKTDNDIRQQPLPNIVG
ncbi:hypothetical protein OAW28_02950 [Alphaproteobacteria bacterium]|nr:hypothetical protein [Alphaproteobacteria bacterium]